MDCISIYEVVLPVLHRVPAVKPVLAQLLVSELPSPRHWPVALFPVVHWSKVVAAVPLVHVPGPPPVPALSPTLQYAWGVPKDPSGIARGREYGLGEQPSVADGPVESGLL